MEQRFDEATKRETGLYHSEFEHDNCGIGAVVNIKGKKSHATVNNALQIVEKLEHRAGKDAEGKTGDGVGILLQISHKFFSKAVASLGVDLGEERDYGIGMFFFPQDELKRNQAKKMFEVIVEKEGMEFLCWREVPTKPEILGKKAVDVMPCIMQAFVKRPEDVEKGLDFDRKLYIVRRVFEQSMMIHMWSLFLPEQSYTKECFWYMNFACSLRICIMRIMNLQSHWCIPVSQRIQRQAGCEHIRIVIWYIMERSIRSVVMQIRCMQEKSQWSPNISVERCISSRLLWIRMVPILQD